LQEFGEHPHCGDKLDKQTGLSYNPEDFYEHGVQFFHFPFCSKPDLLPSMILKMLKSVDYCIGQGFKIAVHSHAGLDRCALLVCSWLIYREKSRMSSLQAIALFRAKRFGSKLATGSSIYKRISNFEVCKLDK
jgi:protein-tyrosine phosphatase